MFLLIAHQGAIAAPGASFQQPNWYHGEATGAAAPKLSPGQPGVAVGGNSAFAPVGMGN